MLFIFAWLWCSEGDIQQLTHEGHCFSNIADSFRHQWNAISRFRISVVGDSRGVQMSSVNSVTLRSVQTFEYPGLAPIKLLHWVPPPSHPWMSFNTKLSKYMSSQKLRSCGCPRPSPPRPLSSNACPLCTLIVIWNTTPDNYVSCDIDMHESIW